MTALERLAQKSAHLHAQLMLQNAQQAELIEQQQAEIVRLKGEVAKLTPKPEKPALHAVSTTAPDPQSVAG